MKIRTMLASLFHVLQAVALVTALADQSSSHESKGRELVLQRERSLKSSKNQVDGDIAADSLEFAKDKLPAYVVLDRSVPASMADFSHNQVCKEVWKNDGYVCNATELVESAYEDSLLIEKGIQEFSSSMYLMKEFLGLYKSKFPSQKTSGTFKMLHSTVLRDYNIPGRIEDARRCWNYMGNLRNSSLCYYCSARNQIYFFKERGLIPLETCSAMIVKCDRHLNMLNRMFGFVMSFRLPYIKEFADSFWKIKAYLAQMFQAPFKDFYSVAKSKTGLRPRSQVLAKVCELSVRLHAKPALLSFVENLRIISGLFRDELLDYTPARLLAKDNWPSRGLGEPKPEDRLAEDASQAGPAKDQDGLAARPLLHAVSPPDVLAVAVSADGLQLADGVDSQVLDNNRFAPMNLTNTFI